MQDVTTVHRPFQGRIFAVEVVSWTGDDGRTIDREIVRHPGAVLIVPQLGGDRLVLVRNWRVAVDNRLWELPAGTLEAGFHSSETSSIGVTGEDLAGIFHGGCNGSRF